MIDLDEVRKTYPNGVPALQGVTLHVPAGECLALVGPSGCGKTTLLRVIAGLEQADGGSVRLGGRVVNDVPPHRRGVAMAFQRPALVPGRSVRDNLGWSWTLGRAHPWHILRALLGRPRWTAAQQRELHEVAGILGIESLLDRRAAELSGGQQQRVALGRALLRRAAVCLLDEPLGHLEAALRTQLRRDLRLLSRRFPATMVHVTHDPAEALAVGDRVAVLHEGRLPQVGPPAELLRRPANRFVAEFCHTGGPLSFLSGRLAEEAGTLWLIVAPWLRLPVPKAVRQRLSGVADVTVGIEGGRIRIPAASDLAAGPLHIMEADVLLTEFAPPGLWVTCRRDGVQLTALYEGGAAAVGPRVMLAISLENALWFATATGLTLSVPAG